MLKSVKEDKIDFLSGMKDIFKERKELKKKGNEMRPEEKLEKVKKIILDILSYRVFLHFNEYFFSTYTEKEKEVFLLIKELNKGMVDTEGKLTTKEILDMLNYYELQKKNDILDRIESLLFDNAKQPEPLEFKKVELGGRRRKKRYTKRYSKKSKVKKNKKRRTMRKK